MSEKQPDLICDTSVVGHLIRRARRPDRYEAWDDVIVGRLEVALVAVSVVTVAEARVGYLNAGWGGRRLAEAESLLRGFRWLPVEQALIDEWSRLQVAARVRGVAIGDNDLWIAATASVMGRALVTCDRDHVRIAPELEVEVLFLQPPV